MKKIFLICIAIFAMFSCSKNEVVDNETILLEKPDLMKIDNVLKMTNPVAQKTAYSLLNEAEKFEIWNNKMKVAVNDTKFNSLQKKLIFEVQKNIKVEDFSKDNNDHKAYFKNIFLKNHLIKLKSSFLVNDIIQLFYNINTASKINNTSKSFYITAKSCNCNKGSIITCNAGSGCLNSTTCKGSTTGCGMFYFWECNGWCDLIPA